MSVPQTERAGKNSPWEDAGDSKTAQDEEVMGSLLGPKQW